ncbi:MAG: hypothetical protein APF77_16595 [Clostridia bacterium BRH_c25]|nr:MAG: hypothetical protein APF77_16595 [Clostridia bacterium BRH_c25]
MITKFDRMQISSINDIHAGRISKVKGNVNSKKVAVPEKETFKYIFENAKKGNEMAAVLLDEWQKNCEPKGNKEEQIIHMINMAANRIFK